MITALAPATSPVSKPAHSCRSELFAASGSDIARLVADPLVAEWESLAMRTQALPFLRPGWVIAWWRAFGGGNDKLAIWSLRRNGRLAAVLPVIHQRNSLRSAANYHTPRAGLLAETNDAAQMLVSTLLAESGAGHATLAALDSLGPDPAICQRAARAAGYRTILHHHERACCLPVQGQWETYEAGLSSNLRTDLQRCRRRLETCGKVTFEVNTGRTNLPAVLTAALVVEASGWKCRHGTAILSSTQVEKFYRDIAGWAAAENMLRLYFLRLDGRPLAMLFAFWHQGTCHLVKGGFDERYRRYSPGKLLMRECIRHCFENKASLIEFHGDAEPYKLRWNPVSRDVLRCEAFAASLSGRLAWASVALRPWLKSVLVRCKLLQVPATVQPAPVDIHDHRRR